MRKTAFKKSEVIWSVLKTPYHLPKWYKATTLWFCSKYIAHMVNCKAASMKTQFPRKNVPSRNNNTVPVIFFQFFKFLFIRYSFTFFTFLIFSIVWICIWVWRTSSWLFVIWFTRMISISSHSILLIGLFVSSWI